MVNRTLPRLSNPESFAGWPPQAAHFARSPFLLYSIMYLIRL
jgi:hypothetical protein